MNHVIASRKDIDFVLHEQIDIEKLSNHSRFKEFNRKAVDLIITEARKFAINEVLPTRQIGDKEGCIHEKGAVYIPKSYHKLYDLYKKGGWLAMSENRDWDGQGAPRIVSMAANEYFVGANSSFMMYPGLTRSIGKLIEAFGTDLQKKLYLKKMYAGDWTGAMLVTEPDAGSDLGAISTTAKKNGDGTFTITGNKIFISSGDHDLTENIIYAVLARMDGAPPGMGALSVFLVPKIWVENNGSLSEKNDVFCDSIEDKMGLHGNPTCSMVIGEKGKCRGVLLGELFKGMHIMFYLINESRRMVGVQGLGYASSAYMHALDYAKKRIQGRSLLDMLDIHAPSVPIIQHPDVRRQLVQMKAYVEGIRSLVYYTAFCFDMIEISNKSEDCEKYQDLIEVLTPIIKGYVTDRAFEVCSQGVQIYGGYGYIKDYPVEQILRDCRVSMIYEGTNGIQALELLGKKLRIKMGKPVTELFNEMKKTISLAKKIKALSHIVDKVEEAVNQLDRLIQHIGDAAISPKIMTAFSFAHPFMDVFGDVLLSWMHLWRAMVAALQLEKLIESPNMSRVHEIAYKNKTIAFYVGKLKTAEFFTGVILPSTLGKINAIFQLNEAMMEIPDAALE